MTGWCPPGPVYVVEPHADDAFLSMGGHLEAWGKAGVPATIVTVFSGTRKRGREAAAYAAAVGAEWVGLGLVESDCGLSGPAQAPFTAEHFAGLGDQPGATRVWPLGLRHPEHKAVAAARPAGELSYVEIPYQLVRKNGPEVTELLAGRTVVSYLRPPGRKYRHVGLFNDQRLFFRYNPPQALEAAVELVVA